MMTERVPWGQVRKNSRIILWHIMETFSASLALCEGNPQITSGFTSQCQQCKTLMIQVLLTWMRCWTKIKLLVIWDSLPSNLIVPKLMALASTMTENVKKYYFCQLCAYWHTQTDIKSMVTGSRNIGIHSNSVEWSGSHVIKSNQ